MEDKYEGLSDEELKEIFEDMQADYWIDYLSMNKTLLARPRIWILEICIPTAYRLVIFK